MKTTVLHIVRLVTFMIALQILNIDLLIQDSYDLDTISSVSAGDADDEDSGSVVEYIADVVVKKIKAIHTNNKKPNKHLQAHKHMGLKMIEPQHRQISITQVGFEEVNSTSFIKNYHYQFCKEITPPPPKA